MRSTGKKSKAEAKIVCEAWAEAERAAAGPLGGARRDGRPRRQRNLLGGRVGCRLHSGPRNTDYVPLQPQMTLAAAPDIMMDAIPAGSRVLKTRPIEPSGPVKELIPREGHGRQSAIADEFRPCRRRN